MLNIVMTTATSMTRMYSALAPLGGLLGVAGKMVLQETSAHLSLASSLPGRLREVFFFFMVLVRT